MKNIRKYANNGGNMEDQWQIVILLKKPKKNPGKTSKK